MSEYTPECLTCRMPKKPIGRDPGPAAANGYCDYECPGYLDDPAPSYWWSDEDKAAMDRFKWVD